MSSLSNDVHALEKSKVNASESESFPIGSNQHPRMDPRSSIVAHAITRLGRRHFTRTKSYVMAPFYAREFSPVTKRRLYYFVTMTKHAREHRNDCRSERKLEEVGMTRKKARVTLKRWTSSSVIVEFHMLPNLHTRPSADRHFLRHSRWWWIWCRTFYACYSIGGSIL